MTMLITYDKKFKRETNITTREIEQSIKPISSKMQTQTSVWNCKQQSHIYIFVSQNCVIRKLYMLFLET
jgi:formyltetrahydrofolate hydrolase